MSLLSAWLAFAKDTRSCQQFGTTDDESTYNGATGCTHTCFRRLIKALTGTWYSHDAISKIATYPWPGDNPARRGMRTGGTDNESGRVIAHFGLPYKIVFGWTYAQVKDQVKRYGPALIAVRYGYMPEDRGYVYNGVTADGRPGGYAMRYGKTQLYGAERIRHAILFFGQNGTPVDYLGDPNHGSPSRPEKPDYEIVTPAQTKRAYDMYAADLGDGARSAMAIVPTRLFRPKGY